MTPPSPPPTPDVPDAGPPAPNLGLDLDLDLDGTVDENPALFATLAAVRPAGVTVVTFRRDRENAAADLARPGVKDDRPSLVSAMGVKAAVVAEHGIGVYVDYQDEMTANMPEGVTVLKIRNGGNFDFAAGRWLYSDRTGENLDARPRPGHTP